MPIRCFRVDVCQVRADRCAGRMMHGFTGSALIRAEAGRAPGGGSCPCGCSRTAPVRRGEFMAYEVMRSRLEYDGALVKIRVDTVVQSHGSRAEREAVEHVGSVGSWRSMISSGYC
jgi:hypothetical protein